MRSLIKTRLPVETGLNSIDAPVDTGPQLRLLPYPYRAILAICSDLDETPDRRVYWDTMRFLNTTEQTAMGQGVGLEVGNSIYFDMPSDQFAYWNTDDAGRAMVRTLIQSGHIDCLHSYGDLATTRTQAGRALEELARHDCKLEIWIDHGTAVTNFDPGIMQGHGDEPGHEAYHADLTMGYGVKYVWRGRVTSITGQDVPAQLGGVFNWRRLVASGQTLLKETMKRQLARMGNVKYSMHGPNGSLRRTILRDGNPVCEFIRCNPHWGGVSRCDQGRHIGEVLTEDMLNRLVERGGTCILYTHLGKIENPSTPFSGKAVAGFRRLSEAFRGGRILVTTTRRLLGYRQAIREIAFSSSWDQGRLRIDLTTPVDGNPRGRVSAADLNGLTFYVPNADAAGMTINGQEVTSFKRNPSDHTGRPSVSLAWPMLEFPRI
jgi:hypothetical protein